MFTCLIPLVLIHYKVLKSLQHHTLTQGGSKHVIGIPEHPVLTKVWFLNQGYRGQLNPPSIPTIKIKAVGVCRSHHFDCH